MCSWAFSAIPRRLPTPWARPKPPRGSSRAGAGWSAPSCCSWCSMCGSCAPSTRRSASSLQTAALTNGQGNIFLWLFCALALLKIAQKCDSYLAALGLSVAQTGSMGIEMLMAARVLTGFSRGGGGNAASVFGGSAGRCRLCCRNGRGCRRGRDPVRLYEPIPAQQLFVRDAVVDGGSRMGAGGGVGFVGRAFRGGMAAGTGATLTPNSHLLCGPRPPNVSGTIGGEIAEHAFRAICPNWRGATANMPIPAPKSPAWAHRTQPPPRRMGGRLKGRPIQYRPA